jgi:hypothetical protein
MGLSSGTSSLCGLSRIGSWIWSFLSLIGYILVRSSFINVDCIHWSSSKKGNFEVKLFYKALSNFDHEVFPWKSIWRIKVPLRVAFFGWTTALGKILTHNNLHKRNIVVVELCCMCKKNGETVDHLLLHYEIASALWHTIFSRFGLF